MKSSLIVNKGIVALEYPFLKGTSCDFSWDEVEKTPGMYDWSILDNAVERA